MPEPEATAITGSITSSLVLAADDPSALAQFYGALLGAQPQPGVNSPVRNWMARAVRPSGSKVSSKLRIAAALRSRRALGRTPRSSTRCPPVQTVEARAWTITSSGNGVGVHLAPTIAACEKVLTEAGLTIQLHPNCTAIEGEWEPVFAAIEACHQGVHAIGCPRMYTTVKINTRADKEQTQEGKVASVQELL